MHIDRTKFLVLAASLAGGCYIQQQAPSPYPENQGAGPPAPAPAPAPAPTATAAPAGTVVGAPPPTGEGMAKPPPTKEGGYVPPPTKEGAYVPAPTGEGYPSSEGGPTYEGMPSLKKHAIPLHTWKCASNDDSAAKYDCVVKAPGCSWSQQSCLGASKYFKPKVAERAATCISKVTTTTCDIATYDCRKAALRSACPDATVDTWCQQAMKGCNKLKLHECRMWMTGLNNLGRAAAVACISNPTSCGYGMYSCVEGL